MICRRRHVGARPLTIGEWRNLLESHGFEIAVAAEAPMHLLEPWRIVRDEGAVGAMRIAVNVASTPVARRRVVEMRGTFRKHVSSLRAVTIVARKA